MNIVTIGFMTEGTTDERFLAPIIKRTFVDIAFECQTEIEIYDPEPIPVTTSKFVEQVLEAAQIAEERGIMVLCIHTDADERTDETAFEHKIQPAFEAVKQEMATICKNLVAIVPVQMIEAWMLADKETLKAEIGTSKSDEKLGINKKPESFADPKAIIQKIINEESPRRRGRQRLNVAYLYSPIVTKMNLEKLSTLPAYQKFKNSVRDAFKKLNYLF